jgi:hypothetical protein
MRRGPPLASKSQQQITAPKEEESPRGSICTISALARALRQEIAFSSA